MSGYEVDETDRQILHMLQGAARGISTQAIADEVGVAGSTVRNRINRMEDAGVIEGYNPVIDYDAAGYPLHFLFLCAVPGDVRDDAVKSVLDLDGVVRVHEMIDCDVNVLVEAIGADAGAIAEIERALEATGLAIERGILYRQLHVQPFGHLGAPDDDADSSTTGS